MELGWKGETTIVAGTRMQKGKGGGKRKTHGNVCARWGSKIGLNSRQRQC